LSHALTEEERARIVEVANEPRFAETPPARIVPALADEGVYIASESSFHRVPRAHEQMHRRGRARPPRRSRPPTTHIATRPGAVWCWDVTFLPATVQGRWFYLYLILDLHSREIVGFEVHDTDSADHAAHLAWRTALGEGVRAMPVRPVPHGDNGASLKGTTVLAMSHWLGIEPSYSRPRVSDDNPYAEALFRTAKYRPEFPVKGFMDLDAAREWAARFVDWYNNEHRHSVTPTRSAPCSRPGTNFTSVPASPTHGGGAVKPATGRRSRRSHSIRSATPASRRLRLRPSFPVRPKRLLSRPGLTMHQPWRATRGKRGAQPPGATRSARFGASMARTARTAPSPKRAPWHARPGQEDKAMIDGP
jgi:transposase InsO family protein